MHVLVNVEYILRKHGDCPRLENLDNVVILKQIFRRNQMILIKLILLFLIPASCMSCATDVAFVG